MKSAGFSLIEVLAATAIVAVGAASLAQLFIVSARAGRTAHAASTTVLLAQQKMEQLRADAADSIASPPSALSANTDGYFEYLDRTGVPVAGGDLSTPPRDAVYVRRWGIEPLAGRKGETIVLKVLVLHLASPSHAGGGSGVTRVPGDARLVGVRTRKAG